MAIPKHRHSGNCHQQIKDCGPTNVSIEVEGHFNAKSGHSGSVVQQQVIVVPGLATPLLGLPAIQDLCLLGPVKTFATLHT